ncbi:MAG TPA: hypothetical protein PLW44_08260, partial [Chitinophagales bacterium]|nr:hypothetical protein [Chitinophagales bacterium]
MEENEFNEPGFGEIVDLVKQYEDSVKAREDVFLPEESYEQIIEFYLNNRENNKALRATESAIEQHS